uniref:Uncharacterized protein n=1 Tax=Mus musculus TaxID=10090 RepID=Q8C7L6_MOUSE|nr:unnamed protein product [Mus musculus]
MESWALVVLLQRTHPACPLCRVPSLRDAIARRSMPPRDKRTEQDTIRQKLSYGGWTGQPKRRKKSPKSSLLFRSFDGDCGCIRGPSWRLLFWDVWRMGQLSSCKSIC